MQLAIAALPFLTFAVSHAQTRGGTLGLSIMQDPPTLSPAGSSVTIVQYVGSKVLQGLLTYGTDLQPRGELAKSWAVSADGLTYAFQLQPNVKWSDGKPFSAADVEFTIGKMLPVTHLRTRTVLNNYIASVKATGELSLEIKLKTPFPPFIYMFETGTMPMMPKHIYEGTDYATNPANQKPIGTGPFVVRDWKRGAYVRLERNPLYWKKDLPYLDGIIFHVIPDAASRAVAFEKGDVQLTNSIDLEVSDINRLKKTKGVEATTKGWELFSPTLHLELNQRKAPFNNVKVRQAIQHALDRRFIVDTIFEGANRPATGPFSYSELFYRKDVQQYPFDLAKARALIKESGLDVGKTMIRYMPPPMGGNYDRMNEYVKQMLEQIGFRIDLQSADGGTWATRMSNWDFDMTFKYVYQYGDPAIGVERLYTTKSILKGTPFVNNAGYSNPVVDELWAKAGVELDATRRAKMYGELQGILAQDVADNWLMDLETSTLVRTSLKNYNVTGHAVTENFDSTYIQK
jgi:peptide/nickel transport system substrate-binding protein